MAHGSFRASLCTPASANLLLNVNQGAGLVAMLIEGQNSLNNTKYPLPADHAALCVPPPQPPPQPISLPDDSGKYTTAVVVGSAFSNCSFRACSQRFGSRAGVFGGLAAGALITLFVTWKLWRQEDVRLLSFPFALY